MKKALIATVAAAALALPVTANAAGNLATQPTDIATAIDGRGLTLATNVLQLETGKYYRWTITGDGLDEYQVMAPELFRNSWINQIVINSLEVKALAVYSLEFDDEGSIVVFFIPVRTGDFDFYVSGFQDRGLKGTFSVR